MRRLKTWILRWLETITVGDAEAIRAANRDEYECSMEMARKLEAKIAQQQADHKTAINALTIQVNELRNQLMESRAQAEQNPQVRQINNMRDVRRFFPETPLTVNHQRAR